MTSPLSPCDIFVIGIAAILFMYAAFCLLILEIARGYRDIRIALAIHDAQSRIRPELPKTAYVQRPAARSNAPVSRADDPAAAPVYMQMYGRAKWRTVS